MIEATALGIALIAGVDARRIIFLALALMVPIVVIAVALVAALGRRRASDTESIAFCEAVAGELRAGAHLADAVARSLAAGGHGSVDLAHMESVFPEIGVELRAVIQSAGSGARVADLFDEIGSLAIAQSEIVRELRVATAPAKVTAAVFVGAPVVYLGLRFGSGSLPSLLASSGQRIAGFVGLVLFTLGAVLVGGLMWRSL